MHGSKSNEQTEKPKEKLALAWTTTSVVAAPPLGVERQENRGIEKIEIDLEPREELMRRI